MSLLFYKHILFLYNVGELLFLLKIDSVIQVILMQELEAGNLWRLGKVQTETWSFMWYCLGHFSSYIYIITY